MESYHWSKCSSNLEVVESSVDEVVVGDGSFTTSA